MMAPPRPLIESKMSKQLTEILKSNVGIRCSSENFPKKFFMPPHTLWNLPRVIVALARKKRFETDSGSAPPTSTFTGGWPATGLPSVSPWVRHSASESLLDKAERILRMSARGESHDTPTPPIRSARVTAGDKDDRKAATVAPSWGPIAPPTYGLTRLQPRRSPLGMGLLPLFGWGPEA